MKITRALLRKLIIFCVLTLSSVCVFAQTIEDINRMIEKGQLEEALAIATRRLSLNGADAQAAYLRGTILSELRRTEEAAAVFSDLVKRHPRWLEAYNSLAVVSAQLGAYDKAIKAVNAGLRLEPDHPTLTATLNDIYALIESEDPENYRLGLSARKAARKTVIINMIRNWASAWSSQNMEAYLSFYADTFELPGRQSRKEWIAEQQRQMALVGDVPFDIDRADIALIAPDQVRVRLREVYKVSGFSDTAIKYLIMKRINNEWKIIQERSSNSRRAFCRAGRVLSEAMSNDLARDADLTRGLSESASSLMVGCR